MRIIREHANGYLTRGRSIPSVPSAKYDEADHQDYKNNDDDQTNNPDDRAFLAGK